MKTLIKWIFKVLAAAILILLIAPLVISVLLEQKDVKATLNQTVVDLTGRNLHIDGRLGIKPGLNLTLFANDLRYDNADWSEYPSAFTARRIEIDISLSELLVGKFSVNKVELSGAELLIEQNDQDDFNLVEYGDSDSGPPQAIPLPEWLDLTRVDIEDSKIVYLHAKRDWEILLDSAVLTNTGQDEPMVVGINGSVEQTPISVRGTLGTLQTWFGRKPSLAFLETRLAGNNLVEAEGWIDDVLDWRGLAIELRTEIDQLKQLSSLFINPPIDLRHIKAIATLIQPGSAGSMDLSEISGEFSLYGIKMKATGRVAKLSRLEQIELDITADSPMDLAELPFSLETTITPHAKIIASLRGESDDLELELQSGLLSSEELSLKSAGTVKNLGGEWDTSLPLILQVTDLSSIGASFNTELPPVGTIEVMANLTRTSDGFALDDIVGDNKGPMVDFTGKGYLHNIGPNQIGEIKVEANTVVDFADSDQFKLPLKLDRVYAAGTISVKENSYSLIVPELIAEVDGAILRGTAEASDMKRPETLVGEFNGVVNSLPGLGKKIGVTLPDLGSVKFNGSLSGLVGNIWSITDLSINANHSGFSIEATGALGELGADMKAELAVAVEGDGKDILKAFPAWSKFQNISDQFKTIHSNFLLKSQSSQHWLVSGAKLTGNWLGTNLEVSGDFSNLSPLTGHLLTTIAGKFDRQPKFTESYELTWLNKIAGRADVFFDNDKSRIDHIDATFSGVGTELNLAGAVKQFTPLKADNLTIKLKAAELASLLPAGNTIESGVGLDADIDLILNDDQVDLVGVYQLGVSDISAALNLKTSKEGRSVVTLVANSELLNLKSLWKKSEKKPQMFSRESLIPDWIRAIDGKITLKAKSFIDSQVKLTNLHSVTSLESGNFLTEFNGTSGAGKLDGEIAISDSAPGKIDIRIKDLPVKSLQALSDGELFVGGTIDSSIRLTGPGDSLAGWMAHGSGAIQVDLYNSTIQNKALNAVGGDIVTGLLSAINPFSEKEEFVVVECGAVRLDIADGKANTRDGLALKTNRVTLLGGGEITFPDESLKIVMAPKPRKGFGISASSIAKMVRIGGTLTNPKVEADAKGFLKSGAAIGAAIASGGLTLVAQGLFDRFQANSEVCALARGEQVLKPIKQIEREQN